MPDISREFLLTRAPEEVKKALEPFVGAFGQSVGWATHIVVDSPDVKVLHPLNGGYHVLNGARTLETAINQYFPATVAKLRDAQQQARLNGLEMTLASGADVSMTAWSLNERGGYYQSSGTSRVLGDDDLRFVVVPQDHPLVAKYNNALDETLV